MFADGVRLAGLDLLSRLQIREGLDLCVTVIEPERWGEKDRAATCLKFLQRYGTHAKAAVPKLLEIREYLVKVKRQKPEALADFDKALAAIRAASVTPGLVSVAEFKSRPAAK
jgi:iron-sulfur cluster repair protein YtfE (RIC family)